MKKVLAVACVLVVLAMSVPLGAEELESHQAFLPMLYNNYRRGYEGDNLICNGSAELGEFCWTFAYPGTGNIAFGDGEDAPIATDGEWVFRYGGWHDMTETGRSTEFLMETGITYNLSFMLNVWTNEWSLDREDTLDVYLIDPIGHHLFLLGYSCLAEPGWHKRSISIGPAYTGYHALLFVAITDEEKPGPWPGQTDFFIDDIVLTEWGDCRECVVCQVLDEPPVEFCDQGGGDDCEGCCPSGDNCAGLDPQCPILPPPHFYREVGRYTECYDTAALVVPTNGLETLEWDITEPPGER